MKAAKIKFREPYRKDKSGNYRVNIPHLREAGNQAGVYLIKSKTTGKIVYIGFSKTQLYKTILRHFQTWNDNRPRIVYDRNRYLVRVIFTTPKRAAVLEKYLIDKFAPRDNLDKIQLELTLGDKNRAKTILADTEFISNFDNCPF
ncbi:MAG: GIY-YIG nuclease family protein [Prolixibacteraceae bacterium]|nr:GIY-YIG nuclease family protein [Prolixibacteraceae bacterium]